MSVKRDVTSLQELQQFAHSLAATLVGGTSIGLCGELGAGKTTFVGEVVRALGLKGPVSSPTYILEQRYGDAGLLISHWDLYRLGALPDELLEPPEPNTIRLIEWSDRFPELKEQLNLIVSFELCIAGGIISQRYAKLLMSPL